MAYLTVNFLTSNKQIDGLKTHTVQCPSTKHVHHKSLKFIAGQLANQCKQSGAGQVKWLG